MTRTQREAAYLAAHYRVRLARRNYATVRIGQPLPLPLLATLTHPAAPWAFVTAWNPLSQKSAGRDNRRHQRQLHAALRAQFPQAVVLAGAGMDATARWCEPSWFIQPVAFAALDRIMRPFQQHAIVRGIGAQPAQLHWYTRA